MFTTKKSRRLLTLAGATALVAGGMSGAQGASPETATLNVTATVTANCTISTSAVAFGAYDPVVTNVSADKDGTGSLSVNCTNGAAATVTLGQGSNADTGSTDAAPVRQMLAGSDLLGYQLYSDSGRNTVWGNTTLTGLSYTGVGTGETLTVYGRIPGGQTAVAAGSYADTVVASIAF